MNYNIKKTNAVVSASLWLLSLSTYANNITDYSSLTDYLQANYADSYVSPDVNFQAAPQNPQGINKSSDPEEDTPFIINNCNCAQYITFVEEERNNKHNMRVEIWLPQDGLIIQDIYTQAHYLEGKPVYSENYNLYSYYHNYHEEYITAANIANCNINFTFNSGDPAGGYESYMC